MSLNVDEGLCEDEGVAAKKEEGIGRSYVTVFYV